MRYNRCTNAPTRQLTAALESPNGFRKPDTSHEYGSNTDLQIIRQFRPTSIPWIHRDKHSTRWFQNQLNTLKREAIQLKNST
jgi:hypothetical protein